MDFALRFRTLGHAAKTLRNTLVAHDFLHTAVLHKFFVVRLLKLDAKSQQYLAANNKIQPVGLTTEASPLPGLWDYFKFKRIGADTDNLGTLSKEPDSLPVLGNEFVSKAARTSTGKADLISRWVQGGSFEVLNPFLPIQGDSHTTGPVSRKAGGSATHTKETGMPKDAAASGAALEQIQRPPSPRKRFGKVRKPKGGATLETLESTDTLLEDISDLTIKDQAEGIREGVRPDSAIVRNVLSGSNHFSSPATVTESLSRREPNLDFKLSETSILPPEILPPYMEPVWEDVVQDQSPAQLLDWEARHAHAAGFGRLVDVPPLSYTPQDVADARRSEPSIDQSFTERGSAPSQELINLLDVAEEACTELSMPLNPMCPTISNLVERPTAPSKSIASLRIVNTEKPQQARSSSTRSITSNAHSDKALSETLQTANEAETRKFRHTMGQQKPAPKKEKTVNGSSIKENRALKPDKNTFRRLNAAAESVLENARYFRGQVKLEVQIGRIMMKNVPNQYRKIHFPVEEWPAIFAAREVPDIPSTVFTNMYVS